jgi:microsomal dipeptidase-like Zn-dependent dipeptidase
VDRMLRRGWSDTRIRKILGGNFLRVVESLRG